MKNFFYKILLISLFYLTHSSEMVLFKLNYETYKESLASSYLYTTMKIGDPKSFIYTYISSRLQLYSMYPVIHKIDEKESLSYYNITTSKSFQNISCLGMKYVSSSKDIYGKEKFIVNLYDNKTNKYRERSINDADFVLGVNLFPSKSEIYFMNIGFPIIKSNTIRDKFDFIFQLKEKEIINDYDWFIYYEKNKKEKDDEILDLKNLQNIKQTLVIGNQPHYYKNEEFYKSQLISAYSDIYKWIINFKDIYLYIKDINTGEKVKVSIYVETVEIFLDSFIIYAPPYYINVVKREFFNKYNSCYMDNNHDIKYNYCEKTDNFTINELKKFPSLYLQHKDFNYTFELTYQDLFVENEGKYWFLAVVNSEENWHIGFPFLKKYQFVFNQESKMISFYHPNYPKEKEIDKKDELNNGSMSFTTIIIIVSIVLIIIIVAGFIIGKILYKKYYKRKRANELEDNYDYITEENERIN